MEVGGGSVWWSSATVDTVSASAQQGHPWRPHHMASWVAASPTVVCRAQAWGFLTTCVRGNSLASVVSGIECHAWPLLGVCCTARPEELCLEQEELAAGDCCWASPQSHTNLPDSSSHIGISVHFPKATPLQISQENAAPLLSLKVVYSAKP